MSSEDDDFDNGKNKRRRGAGAGAIGIAGLILALAALGGFAALTIWHTLLFNSVAQGAAERNARVDELIQELEYRADQLNWTTAYQKEQIALLAMGGNKTVLETGVCTLLVGRFNFPNDVLAETMLTGQLVNYTVIRQGNFMYVIFGNFSTPAPAFSYPSNRTLFPTFPSCDNSRPEFTLFVTFALDACTQDPTNQTFTQSLLNDIPANRDRYFILKTEQDKIEIANNTVKYFGHTNWWYFPPHCFENHYAIYYNEINFVGTITNSYIFHVAISNVTTSIRFAEPFMLLLDHNGGP